MLLERSIRSGLLSTLLAFLLATPAAANDPPFRMEEATPDSSHFRFPAKGLWGYADANGEYALVATGSGLEVIDVTDPTHPVRATRVPSTGADLKEVKTYKHYAYCVNQFGPLQIVDLSDPYHAYTIANHFSENILGAHNIWIEEDGFAYLALQGSGTEDLRILDLTRDPLRPVERGSFDLSPEGGLNSCHDVYVRNNKCYASWFYGGLVILDVTDKDSPQLLLQVLYPGAATHNAWPTADNRYVCTTDEQSGGHLRIWDLEGRLGAQEVAEYATEAIAIIHNAHIKGNHAYIAYYTAGARVVDLTNPLQPLEVGRFDTSRFTGGRFQGCWSVFPYAPSGLIYASDIESGLFVLRFLDAQDGVIRGTLRVHGAEAARVKNAEVWFSEAEVRVVSDRSGYFQANLPPGTHTAIVDAPGFHSETFTSNLGVEGAVNVTVVLDPLPGAVEFVEEPDPPLERGDGRLEFVAQVRAHGVPISEVTLHYRAGSTGSFRALPMVQMAPEEERYSAFLPKLLPGTLVHYFFAARDQSGTIAFSPAEAPATLNSHTIGDMAWNPILAADFESDDVDFTIGSPDDQVEHGFWERAVPVAPPDSLSGERLTQPASDTSSNGPGYCILTQLGLPGSPPQTHEVTGRTTLTSPPLTLRLADGSPPAAARLRLMLWYVNDVEGQTWQDPFLIEGSSDGGVSWRVLESIRVSDPGWQEVICDLGRRLDLRSGRLQVRFVAQDEITSILGVPFGESLVEAAVDDIRVEVSSGVNIHQSAGGPRVALLQQNIPNPFNPSTIITYQLQEPRSVRMAVYDVAGHLVKILVDRNETLGEHAVTWDGRDVRGVQSPSGVYYYQFDTQDFIETRKMLLVK